MAWDDNGKDRKGDSWGDGLRDAPPDLEQILRNFRSRFGGLFGTGKGSGGNFFHLLWVGLAVLLILWAVLGIYQVDAKEKAVILRFGVFDQIKGPGLHWNPPLVDNRFIVNVTTVRDVNFMEQMLTEDENIVDVTISTQYIAQDAESFVLRVRSPERSLVQAAQSALRHVVGSAKMEDVLTLGRETVAEQTQVRLQQYLDNYGTGIQVVKVNIERADPPSAVKAAFDDVIKAREDKERLQNEAETYQNRVVPEARGEKQRRLQEAKGYKERVTANAEGEGQRFRQLLAEYRKAPEITRDRLYIDALQEVLSNSAKVMVDLEGGNNLLYLPLDRITNRSRDAGEVEESPERSVDDIERITDAVIEEIRRRQPVSGRERR